MSGFIDALGPDGTYRTRARETICDVSGMPVAEMSLVPRLYVARTVAAQRKTVPLSWAERRAALLRAADAFETATFDGIDHDRYVDLTCRVSGLPVAVARAGATAVADGLRSAEDAVAPARPAGAVDDWRHVGARGGAVWARRGDVLAVHAPGNAPGVHGLWPQALLLGYRVAVRPSRREPFTAHRLVNALRSSGFRDIDAVYLPTTHAVADEIVAAADLAMVYGGSDVVDRYASDPTVLSNGPGRTKILVTSDRDWRDHLDVIVDSIADLAGMACVNTTAVLVEGEAQPLAAAVAERLSVIPPAPLEDPEAALPVLPVQRARALARYLAGKAGGSTPLLGADQVVAEVGDGFAALRPAVHLLSRPDPAILNVELPFPCVWIAPWSRDDGVAPLRDSLVLNAITGDDALLDALIAEPTIVNVYSGAVATHEGAAHIPHEGFLADFLMRNAGWLARPSR